MAVILPHHNLVATTRQSFLKSIAQKRPITRQIILIGPDHFSANQTQIHTATTDWNLSSGQVEFKDLFLNLSVDNQLLKGDHAIYNPLVDLKTYFPEAKIYPILIGQKVNRQTLDRLLPLITKRCSVDCLLVASVDFSHYLPATLAEVHDAFTIRSLHNFEYDNILNAEVDSPQSLYLTSKFSELKHSRHFSLFAHTNSGFIAHNPDVETTTHVFASFSLGKFTPLHLKTIVATPGELLRQDHQNTLGDRFFYGVDEFQTDSSLNLITATIESANFKSVAFLPFKNHLFVRGQDKINFIKAHFQALSDNSHKDYFWGKLNYEIEN